MTKINFDPCIIDDEQIIVMGSSTSFISHKYEHDISPLKLIKEFNEFKEEARRKGYDVRHQKKTIDFINSLLHPYLQDRQKYEGYFTVLKSGFRNITEREFHFTEENRSLINGLTQIRNEMENLFIHDKSMGKSEIFTKLLISIASKYRQTL